MNGRLTPVLRASARSVLAHRGRFALTFLSVVLGTAFIAGSLLLTSALARSFDSIVDAGVHGIDVGVVGSTNSPQGVPFEVIDDIASWPEVRAINIIGDGPGPPSGTRAVGGSGIIVIGPDAAPLQTGSAGAHPGAAYAPEDTVGHIPVLIDGAWPTAPDEVMLNAHAVEQSELKIGDRLLIISPRERSTVRMVGVYDSPRDSAGWISVLFTPDSYRYRFTEDGFASQVVIAVEPWADPMLVRNRIGLNYGALTPLLPEQIIERMADSRLQQLDFVRYILVIFGAVALFIGSLNIVNTFAMVVGQRTKEFALLRSIGVSTFQVAASVVTEAAIIGFAGSVVGIVTAIFGVGFLLAVMQATGGELTSVNLTLTAESVFIPLVFGVVITMAAALAPARRAAMLPPVQAFDLSDARSSRLPILRLLISGAMFSLGAILLMGAALISSVNGRVVDIDVRLILVAAGLILGLWSLVLSGPSLIVAVGGTLGRAITWPMGVMGQLARQNSIRNPRRSATSALALALGVGLVAGVGTVGSSARASVFGAIESSVTAPFVLDSLSGGSVQGRATGGAGLFLPPESRELAQRTSGVADTGTLMSAPLQADNWNHPTTTVLDSDVSLFMDLNLRAGAFSDPQVPAAALSAEYAEQEALSIGDYIPLTVMDGVEENAIWIPVTAIYGETALLGHIAVTWAAADAVLDSTESAINRTAVFVTPDGSVSDTQLRANLEAAVAPLLVVQVKSSTEYTSALGNQINQLLLIIYALLALAVIIATLGIVNTLLLSVAERSSEIGTLRAIGLQRWQVRRMIEIESLILTVHGAVVGVLAGTSAGWAVVRVLAEKGMTSPSIPWPQITAMVGAAVVVGVLASVVPALKAAATPPLEAIER
ncbi:MAG: FtsX-like permease family protein [Corynebacterium sp.]|uniref:FtsX-like permease family protein n=1 Tax=Corynebacterium sp. TaxID=1720 RepID=UPI0026DF9A64|nr:ABC transporter permease [Corynebacterium sp.]MDO5669227.1 FtsX-like permease family protein [Corynebacterium sp.]